MNIINFSGKEDKAQGTVKFIMMTDKVEKKKMQILLKVNQ